MKNNNEKYYKDAYGFINIVNDKTMKHKDGDYTFLAGRTSKYTWIKTADLYDSYDDAKKSEPARFL